MQDSFENLHSYGLLILRIFQTNFWFQHIFYASHKLEQTDSKLYGLLFFLDYF